MAWETVKVTRKRRAPMQPGEVRITTGGRVDAWVSDWRRILGDDVDGRPVAVEYDADLQCIAFRAPQVGERSRPLSAPAHTDGILAASGKAALERLGWDFSTAATAPKIIEYGRLVVDIGQATRLSARKRKTSEAK